MRAYGELMLQPLSVYCIFERHFTDNDDNTRSVPWQCRFHHHSHFEQNERVHIHLYTEYMKKGVNGRW